MAAAALFALAVAAAAVPAARGQCDPECGAFGRCVVEGVNASEAVCECGEWFEGEACETPVCEPGCGAAGACVGVPDPGGNASLATTRCDCGDGAILGGPACETPLCDPSCSAYGACVLAEGNATTRCACAGPLFEGPVCDTPVCDPPCSVHGTCLPDPASTPEAPATRCECGEDGLFRGAACDTPVCTPACTEHGTCVADGNATRCACSSELFGGLDCGQPQCTPACSPFGDGCVFDAEAGRTGCVCDRLHGGPTCSELVCPEACQNGGNCTSPPVCECPSGWGGDYCTVAVCIPACSNGGFCSASRECLCPSGWKGGHCQEPEILALPPLLVFVAFGIVTVASWSIGKFVQRMHLPLITGYIFVGILAGPHVLDLITEQDIRSLDVVDKVALSFIAFAAGSKLYLHDLRGRLRAIAAVATMLVGLEYLLGTLTVSSLAGRIEFMKDMSSGEVAAVSMLVATLLVARSPASAIAIIKELRASGPFTLLSLGVTVVLDVSVLFMFSINMLVADRQFSTSDDSGGASVFGQSLLRLFISVAGGVLVGLALPGLVWGWTRWFRVRTAAGKRAVQGVQIAIFVGLSASISVLEHYEHAYVEPLILATLAGFVVTNYSARRRKFQRLLHTLAPAIFVAFFTLTGSALALDAIGKTILLSLVLVTVRAAGIFMGAYIGGRVAGEPERFNRVSWLTYITQAGVSLGLAKKVHLQFPEWGSDFTTVIVSVVVINQLCGPPLMRYAIRAAGEDGKGVSSSHMAVVFGDDIQAMAVGRTLRHSGWAVTLVRSARLYAGGGGKGSPRGGAGGAEDGASDGEGSVLSDLDSDVGPRDSAAHMDEPDLDENDNFTVELVERRPAAAVTADEDCADGGADDADGGRGPDDLAARRAARVNPSLAELDDMRILDCIGEDSEAVVIMYEDMALVQRICFLARQQAPTARIIVRMTEDDEDHQLLDDGARLQVLPVQLPPGTHIVYPTSSTAQLLANAVLISEVRVSRAPAAHAGGGTSSSRGTPASGPSSRGGKRGGSGEARSFDWGRRPGAALLTVPADEAGAGPQSRSRAGAGAGAGSRAGAGASGTGAGGGPADANERYARDAVAAHHRASSGGSAGGAAGRLVSVSVEGRTAAATPPPPAAADESSPPQPARRRGFRRYAPLEDNSVYDSADDDDDSYSGGGSDSDGGGGASGRRGADPSLVP